MPDHWMLLYLNERVYCERNARATSITLSRLCIGLIQEGTSALLIHLAAYIVMLNLVTKTLRPQSILSEWVCMPICACVLCVCVCSRVWNCVAETAEGNAGGQHSVTALRSQLAVHRLFSWEAGVDFEFVLCWKSVTIREDNTEGRGDENYIKETIQVTLSLKDTERCSRRKEKAEPEQFWQLHNTYILIPINLLIFNL